MSAVLAQWGVSYAPGSWIALSGPTSLVVLLPSANGWTPLLDTLWAEVLGSTSLVELAGRLAEHGLEAMPSFGAFFWTPAGMRSLVRGDVVVRDAGTDAVVANGQGIQTWSEIGLNGIDRIRIETPGSTDAQGHQLPLVVGAALVSSLVLDACADAVVESPQGDELDTEPLSAEEKAAIESGGPLLDHGQGGYTPPDQAEHGDTQQDHAEQSDTQQDHAEQSDPEQSDTEQMAAMPSPAQLAPATATRPEVQPPPAQLVLSDGTVVALSQPVRIGRAPSADGASEDVLLVTVRSPQQDISRTHLEVAEWDGEVVVTDLHSTNGTAVTVPGAMEQPERLPAGTPVAVPLGSVLDIGDNVLVRIEVARSA